jgi:tRNA(Ile)-lysidine synthase
VNSCVDLIAKLEENIARHKLLASGARVIVAVSGGVDSMVLLDVLYRLRKARKWRLELAHFNHQLRGDASDADEQFVRGTAGKLGLAFHVDRGDVAGLASSKGISIEMAGRELRHLFLARIAVPRKSFQVALAHHADDQVETFLLRLLRGDVGAGLAGMRWCRRASADSRVKLVRPLLNISKQEITEYARAAGLAFRQDLTNVDLHYQRNRIRHEILSSVEKYQPQVRSIILRTVEVLADEKDFLGQTARDWLRRRRPAFEMLHTALQREVIRQQLLETAVTPTFELIDALRTVQDKIFTVSGGRQISRNSTGLVGEKNRRSSRFDTSEEMLSLVVQGELWTGKKTVAWEFVERRGKSEEGVEYFDRDAVGEDIVIRRWRAGDRFRPIGATHAIKLQDLFTNLKVSSAERRERLVGAAQNGEIFWVEGIRIGENFKVHPETRKILKWTCRPSPATSV